MYPLQSVFGYFLVDLASIISGQKEVVSTLTQSCFSEVHWMLHAHGSMRANMLVLTVLC